MIPPVGYTQGAGFKLQPIAHCVNALLPFIYKQRQPTALTVNFLYHQIRGTYHNSVAHRAKIWQIRVKTKNLLKQANVRQNMCKIDI